jgi:hypothetical protein
MPTSPAIPIATGLRPPWEFWAIGMPFPDVKRSNASGPSQFGGVRTGGVGWFDELLEAGSVKAT